VAWTEGTVALSLELGLRPLQCAKARRRGRIKGERSTGSLARASMELEWHCSDRVTAVQNREVAALGERVAQAWREGKRSGERCGETR
jgi:hypothetical protein